MASTSAESGFDRPESVLIVVVTPSDEFLLLRRIDPPDYWQSVTGSLRWDEAPIDAAWRELIEETGLTVMSLRETGIVNRYPIAAAWRHRFSPDVTENIEHVFLACADRAETIRLNPEEHGGFLWVPREQALKLASSTTNRAAIAAIPVGGV